MEGDAGAFLQPSAGLKNVLVMYWIILILAGLCECTFTFCLGRTRGTAGMEYALWLGSFFAFSALSMLLLMKATQQIPVGTAYPIWTGIGAAGTVLIGIFVFGEPATFWRLFFITTLVASIVGLKLV